MRMKRESASVDLLGLARPGPLVLVGRRHICLYGLGQLVVNFTRVSIVIKVRSQQYDRSGVIDAYGAVRGALGYMPIRDEVEIDITEPADGSRVSGRKEVRGLITTTGNVTLEEITLRIGGNRYNVTVAEVWMYRWNSWDVENGNYTLTATVIANNRSLSSTVSIMVSVNNTGEDPGDDDDPFFDIDDLRELNEITLSLMAVVAVAIIVSVVVFKRRHGGDGGTEEQDEYYDGEDDGSA